MVDRGDRAAKRSVSPDPLIRQRSHGSANRKRRKSHWHFLRASSIRARSPNRLPCGKCARKPASRPRFITKLTDIKYVYVRTWSDSERVFKIVSFYLFRYESGRIDDVTEAMRIEVKRSLWIPLAGATKLLAYSNERKVVRLAEDYVAAHPEL